MLTHEFLSLSLFTAVSIYATTCHRASAEFILPLKYRWRSPTQPGQTGKAPRTNERPRLVSHKPYWYIMDIYEKKQYWRLYGRLPTWEIRLQRNVSTQDLMNGGSYCVI